MHAAGGMPRRTCGELGAFEQHHIGPAGAGEVKQHRGAHDAAADDDGLHPISHG